MLTQKFLDLTASFGADWVNFVLLGVSVIGLGVFIDRAVFFVRTAERFPALRAGFSASLAASDLAAALRAVEGDSLARNVVRAGLELAARGERQPAAVEQAMLGQLSEERGRYESRLSILATIGNVAPLIGLLGTVIGIVGAFYVLGKVGTVQASSNSLVMSSIGEALDGFYDEISRQLSFPEHFGRNLDALWDVLSADIGGPIDVVWENADSSRNAMERDFNRLLGVLKEVEKARKDFRLRLR